MKKRHELAFLAWLGLMLIFISKQNLSIAVIGMNSNNSSELEAEKSQCPVESSSNSSEQEIFLKNEFSWTEKQEMLLLGCYYYGYVIFHMVGGWIGFKFGFKKLLFWSSLIGAFINLVFPFSIRLSFTFGVALRIALGISHSGSSAAMTEAWSKWAPQDEKSFLLNFIFSGMTFGLLLTNLAGGWIIQSFGWPVIFYIPAICTFFWAAIWHFRVSETPEKHKTIEKEELDLIISTRSGQKRMEKKISFLKLFTYLPVWGFIIGCVGKDFAAFTAMQMFPMYMNRILGFDIKASGAFSALPMFCLTISEILIGYLSDISIRSIGIEKTRKGSIIIGAIGCGGSFLAMNFIGCSIPLAMFLLNSSLFWLGLYCVNIQSNVLDFGAEYAGRINSISNTFSNSAGFAAPQLAGAILEIFGNTRKGWGYTFALTTAICISSAIFGVCTIVFENIFESKNENNEEKKPLK